MEAETNYNYKNILYMRKVLLSEIYHQPSQNTGYTPESK
jgi:hypothetical protein